MDLINNDTELLENVKERYKQGYRGIRQIAYTSATQETNLDIVKVGIKRKKKESTLLNI